MQLQLPDDVAAMVRERLASGAHIRPEDVVREAMAALAARVAWEKRMWDEGMASGDWREFDAEEIIREARAEFEKR